MKRRLRNILTCLLVLFAISQMPLVAEILTLSWQGTITSVTAYKEGAVPEGVSQGAAISGSVVFDTTKFASRSSILGNVASGDIYRYPQNMTESIQVGSLIWTGRGGEVILTRDFSTTSTPPIQGFDVETKETSSFTSYPKNVGSPHWGFVLYDESEPYELFNSTDLDSTTLNFTQITKGNGDLSTRSLDQASGDIIDGYFFTYDIQSVSSETSPSLIEILALAKPAHKGSVVGSGGFAPNSWRSLVARPRQGRRFIAWTENGRVVCRKQTIRFHVTRQRTLIAHFR